jgi:hypothetical protein
LRDDGFKSGIDLAPGAAPVGTMSDLTTMLLEAFDRGRRPVAPGYIPGSDSKPSGD